MTRPTTVDAVNSTGVTRKRASRYSGPLAWPIALLLLAPVSASGQNYPLVTGWHQGKAVQYYDFGASAAEPGTLYRLPDGSVVFSSVPGASGYSPIRAVVDVQLSPGDSPQGARSRTAILTLVRQGRARLTSTRQMVNVPIVTARSTLENDPARRPISPGWHEGAPVSFYDFGTTAATPMPAVAFKSGAGSAEITLNSIPGQPGYSDLWSIEGVVGASPGGDYRDYRRVLAESRHGRLRLSGHEIRNHIVVLIDGQPAARGPSIFSRVTTLATTPPAVADTVVPGAVTGPGVVAPAPTPPAKAAAPAPTAVGGINIASGIAGQLAVRPPQVADPEAQVTIDGSLDEPPWSKASVLTGFSQFYPVDGRPAVDSTEVLVWYSRTAMYFGIKAFEAHGAVHATLADRDKIQNDDHVQILLDTFNDHRRAMMFAVNPFGVQSDGNLTEGLQTRGGGGIIGGPSSATARDTADLSADYTFQSKGRLTDFGYQVEVRIPFKSIRFQSDREQTWGLNVARRIQHSGYEDTWTPARRSTSFLAQSGKLEGISNLDRGLVLDLNPVLTSKITGAPAPSGTGWSYDTDRPEIGGNVRWGVTSNLTLNGTVKPDFSQVEADVQQVNAEPRSALFYPEKRPFFLEGIEQFETPNQLIYTRRVVQPVTAAKLTGKAGSTTIGLLSAIDNKSLSTTGTDNPIYGMVRLKHDLGRQSTAGLVYTDRIDGDNYNRMLGIDTRIVLGKIYSVSAQGAGSLTRVSGVTTRAPMFDLIFERSGRALSMRYDLQGFHPNFRASSGFLRRTNIANLSFGHRFTFYGKPGALLESWSLSMPFSITWNDYRSFFNGGPLGDIKNDNSVTFTFRGGWRLGAIFFPESFKYDPNLFANYAIERNIAGVVDTVPFVGTDRLRNWDVGVNFGTPQFAKFNAFLSVLTGQDENFVEWSSAWVWYITAQADIRPTDKIRISARYQRQQFVRMTDWTTSSNRNIPRLKIEYQIARPIFVRVVGQYDMQWLDNLRDDSRTNFPLLIRNGSTGVYELARTRQNNNLRVDWLFSFQPNPGTVLFAGYGSSMTETDALTFRDLHRVNDGFFLKLSYLFHVQ